VYGQVKKKVAAIADSLFGTLTEHQIFMIRASWNHITFLEESLAKLDERVGEYLKPYEEEVTRIDTVPGISRVTAAAIIAEIGVNMDQFPTADHLASWAGVAPGNYESAGKKKVPRPLKATHM
jgi:transposase